MDPQNISGFEALPPVSLTVCIIQIAIYFTRGYYISYEEDIWVSWPKVVDEMEVWRLFIAQYFHFSKTHLFYNVLTLMTTGRFLEKKLTKTAMVVLINLLGVVTNILFVALNVVICPPEEGIKLSEISYGFTSVLYALRMVLSFCKQPPLPDAQGVFEPSLLFGFFPVFVPDWLVPWLPMIELSLVEVLLGGVCSTLNVSGIIAGLLFPSLSYLFPTFVYRDPPYRL